MKPSYCIAMRRQKPDYSHSPFLNRATAHEDRESVCFPRDP
jgi:hypothetical protein